jgi:lipopolysaccharide export system permease protein
LIISRYLTKEVMASLLGVTVVLLLIFLSNQLVRYLSYAASGKIAANLVMQLMGFEIPYLLALLLPLGLYLGIILAYGRLYADSEMAVLNACGFGPRKLLSITGTLAIIIAAIVMVLMLWVNPIIAEKRNKGIAQHNMLDTLQPGRFQVINGGRWVVYVEEISRNRQRASNIFIAEEQPHDDNDAWVVVSAAQGYQAKNVIDNGNFIVAADGFRYDGTPGLNAYKIMQFKKYGVRLPEANFDTVREEQETLPTAKLWQNYNNPDAAAELQWRLAIPVTVLVLALLAVPLSQVRPRQGRYSHLVPAILLYIIYVNLLFVARNWIEQKMVPSMLAMWLVHSVLLCIAIVMLVIQQRYQARPFPRIFARKAV